jgi:hypothetical protein
MVTGTVTVTYVEAVDDHTETVSVTVITVANVGTISVYVTMVSTYELTLESQVKV